MYWPVGTPRVFATSSNPPSALKVTVSHDGIPIPSPGQDTTDRASLLTADSVSSLDVPIPGTPLTPHTPAIRPVEHNLFDAASIDGSAGGTPAGIPLKEPILALRVSRTGHVFAVITATSMTIWQAKVRCNGRGRGTSH